MEAGLYQFAVVFVGYFVLGIAGFGSALIQRKGQVWPYVRKRWPVAAGGAFASIGSYAIALWAMTVAPVAMVAALRETSVFFAALIGAWFFKEVWTRQRIAGIVAILSGVAALRLG